MTIEHQLKANSMYDKAIKSILMSHGNNPENQDKIEKSIKDNNDFFKGLIDKYGFTLEDIFLKIFKGTGLYIDKTIKDFQSNQFKSMPTALSKLKNLVSLSIFFNKLNLIPSDMGRLASLKLISLSNNLFK